MNKNNVGTFRTFTLGMLTAMLLGCGISGTGGPSRSADNTDKQTPQDGQAVLGPIIGAGVTIRDIEHPEAIACATTTLDDIDLAKAGTIRFDQPCIFSDRLYLVTITGGNDVDYNDDGIRDTQATPNTGEFRALLSGAQLLQHNWKTNALTEAAYQAVQYALQQGDADVPVTLDNLARQFINSDLNADGSIDRLDIALWHPVSDASVAINADKLRFTTGLIHDNRNRTLIDIPATESVVGHIDTLAPARQVVTYDDRLLVTTDTALLVYRYENAQATLLASLALGWIYDVAITSDAIYVALGANGIARLDPDTLQVTQRWNTMAERITSLQGRVIFSGQLRANEYVLTTLTESGELQQLLRSGVRIGPWTGGRLPRAQGVPLKSMGDIVYWAPDQTIERFTLRDGQLHRLPVLEPADDFYLRVITDIEVAGTTAYAIASGITYDEYSSVADLYQMYWDGTLDELLQSFLQQKISTIDISNIEAPLKLNALEIDDVDSLRYINGALVGLNAHDISLRDNVSLRPLASLPLPATFTGFDAVKGLELFQGLLAVAAQENGVLLLDPQRIPVKRFYGKVLIQEALAGASVNVKKLPENTSRCITNTDADGVITLTADCLDSEAYYLLEVTGGTQTIGGVPQPFAGSMHTIMHKADFVDLDGSWHISPLTELAWRTISPSLQVGTQDISHGLDDLAQWWLMPPSNTNFLETATAEDIYYWPNVRENTGITFDATTWHAVVSGLSAGNWAADTLQQLTGATAFATFDTTRYQSANNAEVLIQNTSTATQIRSATPPFALLSTIPPMTAVMALDGDRLVAFSESESLVRIFNIADPAQPVALATLALTGAQLQLAEFSHYCLTAHALYQIVSDGNLKRVRAWRIGDNELTSLGGHDYSANAYYEGNEWCSDNILALGHSGRIDLFLRTDTALTLTESIALPANYRVDALTLTNDELFYFASEYTPFIFDDDVNVPSTRAHLRIDTSGHTQPVITLNTTGNERSWMTPPPLLPIGDLLYHFAAGNVLAFDRDSLQLQQSLKPPVRFHYRPTAVGNTLVFSSGHSLWQYPAAP